MSIRGNKPVGWTARLLLILSAVLIVGLVIFSIVASRRQQAFPERGAASLPAQAAGGGAQPSPQ